MTKRYTVQARLAIGELPCYVIVDTETDTQVYSLYGTRDKPMAQRDCDDLNTEHEYNVKSAATITVID